jgi:hypothetical protein
VKILSGGEEIFTPAEKEPPLGTEGINNSPPPAYYAVIPANVRYDKNLPPNAKLLYGEITALCNKYGYCWAFNAYFARLYETSERTIINWINALRDKGYISVEFVYAPGKKGVHQRNILIQPPKSAPAGSENPPVPPDGSGSGENHPPWEHDPAPGSGDTGGEGPEGGVKIFSGGEEIFTGGVKESSSGGEDSFTENITCISKFNTSSSPPGGDGEEAPVLQTPEQLKKAVAGISPLLVFNAAFYPKAAAFLAARGFTGGYLSWLCEFCLARKPRSLAGLYFSLFFSEQAAELYLLARKERSPPPPVKITCPVCGFEHDQAGPFDRCPSCGLKNGAAPEDIAELKIYRALPDGRKTAFDRELAGIRDSSLDFREKGKRLALLLQRFGFL